jgi:parvulin-like peptidyl-prolyl isomerase
MTVAGKIKFAAVLFLAAVLILSGCADTRDPSVYAVVNGQEITREDYQLYENFLRLAQPELELSRSEQKQILQDLIDLKVYLAEAGKRGIEADMDEVQEEFDAYRAQILKQDLFGGSGAIYYTRLQELGLNEDWIMQLFRDYQVINAMVEAEREKAEAPADEAIEEYYQEQKETLYAHGELRKVRHILVNAGNFPDSEEDVSAEVKDLADNLYQRLKAGEDFALLAKEFSQDSSAQNGGDIGFIEKENVVESFGEAAFSLDLNVVSQPVESKFGWHILEVTEIQPAGYYELDEALNAQISASLLQTEQKKLVEKLLSGLKDAAEITIKFK